MNWDWLGLKTSPITCQRECDEQLRGAWPSRDIERNLQNMLLCLVCFQRKVQFLSACTHNLVSPINRGDKVRSDRLKRGDGPLFEVRSMGRRNTFAKSLCGALEVQRFPRTLVELAGDLVELGLGVR